MKLRKIILSVRPCSSKCIAPRVHAHSPLPLPPPPSFHLLKANNPNPSVATAACRPHPAPLASPSRSIWLVIGVCSICHLFPPPSQTCLCARVLPSAPNQYLLPPLFPLCSFADTFVCTLGDIPYVDVQRVGDAFERQTDVTIANDACHLSRKASNVHFQISHFGRLRFHNR